MAKLPRGLSGREVVAALRRVDFYVLHQRGSHVVLRRDEPKTTISVPDHRVIRIGTLKTILNQAGLQPDEFEKLL